jgi:DNA repair exonuclease SbcCD nuclease subunit
MAGKLKFIHTADIHLGSILHLSDSPREDLLDLVNHASYYAFEYICSLAIENNVDFIIISGDLYDKEARSVRASKFFIEQCERLRGKSIKVYVIYGNHDPLTKEAHMFNLPNNVFVFDSNNAACMDYYNIEGELSARIVGQSYRTAAESRKMHDSYIVPDNSVFNIALLHTQLNSTSKNYVPSTSIELKENRNINYWALGHIHKYNIISKDNPAIVYPGIPQGRDIGETGVGGVLLVEVEDKSIINLEYILTSLVAWKKVEIKIDEDIETAPENISELEDVILKKAENMTQYFKYEFEEKGIIDASLLKGFMIHWVISGRGVINEIIKKNREEIEQVLIKSLNDVLLNNSPFIWSDSIEFKTSAFDRNIDKIIEENQTFREVNKVAEFCISEDKVKLELLKVVGDIFEYSDDNENFNEQKIQIDDKGLAEIILKAKQLAFEKLLERGD